MWDTKKIQLLQSIQKKKKGSVCAVCSKNTFLLKSFGQKQREWLPKSLFTWMDHLSEKLLGCAITEKYRCRRSWQDDQNEKLQYWVDVWFRSVIILRRGHGIYSKCCRFLMIISFTVSFHLCCVYQLNSIRYYCFYSQMHLVHFDSES